MGCSCAGTVALVVLFVAVVLNVVAFVLPIWTTSTVVNESLEDKVSSTDFTAGVWGFCTDVRFSSDSNSTKDRATFNHCYLFHTSNEYDASDLVDESDAMVGNFSMYSVCDGFSRAADEGSDAQLEYSSELATTAGMDAEQFDVFLDKSCGALGSSTLVFGGMSMASGVLSFVALTLGITCCKKRSIFVLGGRIFVILASLSTVLMFALWLAQAHPLSKGDDVMLNGSFVLAVIAAVLYLIVVGLVARHATVS